MPNFNRFTNPLNDTEPTPEDAERRDAAAEDKADDAWIEARAEQLRRESDAQIFFMEKVGQMIFHEK